MRSRTLVAFAVLWLLSLPACGGGNTAGGLAGAPATNAIVPLIKSVVVTAVYGKMRLPNLEISLRRESLYGKVITKGKTGGKGQVKLSGNWTDTEKICAGGTYRAGNRYLESWHCERPLHALVTVNFEIKPPPR